MRTPRKTVNVQTKQVPFQTRKLALKHARLRGFNTLQDAIRLFINQLAVGKVEFNFHKPDPINFLNPQKSLGDTSRLTNLLIHFPVKKAYLNITTHELHIVSEPFRFSSALTQELSSAIKALDSNLNIKFVDITEKTEISRIAKTTKLIYDSMQIR